MEAMETVQQGRAQAIDKTKALQLVLLRCLMQDAFDFRTDGDDLILETSEETVVIHFHLVPEPKPLQHDDLNCTRATDVSAKYFIFTNCPVDRLNFKNRENDQFDFLNLTNLRELATERVYVDRTPSDLNPSIADALREFTSQRGISRFSSQLILNRFHSYLRFVRSFTRSDIKLALLELFVARYKVDLFYDTRISCSELWADITRDSPLIAVESEFANETFLKSHTAGLIAKFGDSSEIAYRNLWVSGEVSLLVSAASSDDYLNVVNIVKAFSTGLKVTVLTVSGDESVLRLNEEQAIRLLRCEANLQGKSTFRLSEFVDELTSLRASDAIRVITNNLIVDYWYKKPPEYFIERSYAKVIIRLDVVASLAEETFVVKDEVDGVNVSLSTQEGLSNLVIVRESPMEARETDRPVHFLVSSGENWLEWKSSWGCTDGIKKFDISQECRLGGDLAQLARDRESKVRLLAMEASMGKSTVLDHLALSMTDRWVLGVDLLRYLSENSRKIDLVDLYRFCTQDNSELAQLLFGKFADAKKVEVLFDNYDQAILHYSDEALELLTSLQQKNVGFWVIASGRNAGRLEKRLATIAIPLDSFNVRNSRDFLVKYFGQFGPQVNTFVETLLGMLRREIDAFLDSPLYLTLIANTYIEDLKHFVLTGGLRLEDNFQLINFLETFTAAYVNYLTDKYDLCDNKFFSHRLPMLSIRAVFDPSDLDAFEDVLAEFAKEGIVECELPHAIMAQFLSAKWMYENLSSRRSTVRALNRRRFSDLDRYRGTFTMFDLLLAKDLPLHTTLIRSKMKYSPAETCDFTATDLGGRNAVHMAALYGACHPRTNILRGIDLNDQLVNIVTLSDLSTVEADDTLLGYSALDYALSSGCLAVANAICEKSPRMVGRVHMVPTQVESYIAYCVQIDHYTHLYKSLLKYLICDKVATSQLRENMEASSFSAQLELDELTQETVETYIRGFEVTSLSHLMEKLELKKENSRYFTNLHLAAAFGCKRNILGLLKEGAKINNLSSRSYTPLHAAVNHNRADNVDALLAARAKINVIDVFGNTALHLACARRNPQMVTKLMRRGTDISIQNDAGDTPFHHALKHSCEQSAELFLPDKYYSLFFSPQTSISRDRCLDVNLQNKNGDTPLLLALKHDCGGIVRELLEYHADVNAINQSGNSCLHYAVEVDDYKTALELIYYRVNLNGVNSEGQTPLLIALKSLHVRVARLLLSKGAHVDGCDRMGMTCLHYAAQTGLVDLVEAILDKGVEINRRSNEGDTPLGLALTRKSVDIVLLLLRAGADPNIPDGNGRNALHRAIEGKLMGAVKALVEHGCDMDHRDNDGDAPLFTALRLDAVAIVKLLLARGADPSGTNATGSTCLHVATSLMEDFLKMGLDVNAADNNGNTPLMIASEERRAAIMNLLIANGADILAENKEGYTVLHHAAHYALTDSIVDLLNRGADINKKTRAGETPLSLHIRDWHLETNTTRLLLTRGAEANVIDLETGNSLLHYATEKGQTGVVRALLNSLVDLHARNNDGETALHLAVKREHYEITKLLLAKGANANGRNNGGDTCLHSAVATDSSEMVMALLQHGAKTDATDGDGETPASKAQSLGYSAIVNLLLKKNGKWNVGLLSAVTKGEMYTVRKLIEGGADINVRDDTGNTPLLVALNYGHLAISDFLLSKGADVTARTNDGCTALYYAAELGDIQIVREVLGGGCDIDAVNSIGDSALVHAMIGSHFHIAHLLLERNAKVELPPRNRKGSCLHVVCAYGSEDLVARLLDAGLDATKFGENGMTPLIQALAMRHRRIALSLIEHGVDLNVITDYTDSALVWAISHQYCDVITLLIEKGVLFDYWDDSFGSPLKTAIADEKREAVKLLLSRGCNVHLGSSSGGYPLHAAAAGDLTDFVSTILDNGFDVDKKTVSGGSALFVAADRGNYATTTTLISNGASLDTYSDNFSSILCLAAKSGWEEMVEDLIKNGADIHHRNNENETSIHFALRESRVNVVKLLFKAILAHDPKDGELNYLHMAAEFGDNQIVSEFLTKGFAINKQNDYGETPLLLALHYEKLSTAKLLLANGADRNVISYGEALPCFHAFARFGWDDMVLSMLEEGVDVNTKSHLGFTPLHVATQNENLSTIRLLLAHGADPAMPSAYDDTPLQQCIRNHCKRTLKAFLEKIDASKSQKCVNSAAFSAVDNNHPDLLDVLIEFGVDNYENSYGDSTLSNAVKNGYHSIVRHLLDRNGNVDELNSSGDSLVMIAAKSGEVDMAKLLLERGADVTIANYEGDTCLHLAACDTDEMLTLFLDRCNLEAKNLSGLTPLMSALKLSFAHSAQLLISSGADVHTEDFMGNTCLQNAAWAGDEEMVALLLENGLDMHQRNAEGDDCLDMAINNGSLSVAKLLIVHGADPNQTNRYGETCLLKAVQAGNDLVGDLLARDVDVNYQGNDGHTPFTQALESCSTDHAKLLLAKNADVSVRNRQGSNLHYAISQGVEIVDALLDLGVNEQDDKGNTPLLLAVKSGALETVKLLLDKGADVRVKDNEYNTCLHYATDHSDVELLQMFLVGKGIDVNCSNARGETPLLRALKGDKLDHAKILLGEGADCSVVDNENGSCLVYCAQFGFDELLADFISRGYDVNRAHSDGTPLQMAFKGKHAGAVKLLLANGADIHSCASYYETWVDHVIALADVEVMRMILAQGIDVNARLSRGEPLLITALREKCRDMVDFLIAAGANARLVSYATGDSCLHHAARAGYEDNVGDFLDKGLDIDRENMQRETPLRVALIDGNCAIAKLLLSRGASIDEGNFRDSYLHHASKLSDDSLVLDLITKGCELNARNGDGHTALYLAVVANNVAVVNLLLEQGADFTVRDKADRNLLYAAKSVDAKELVDQLVNLGLADEEF